MSKETFTRENLIDHLQRSAFAGVGAVVGLATWSTSSDLRGGRTLGATSPLRVRERSSQCGAVSHGWRRECLAGLRRSRPPFPS